MTEGRFIVFEGGEGCGKSTQSRLLAEALGPTAILTREPGATALGAALRAILLDPGTGAMDHRAEALLMAADRAQHVAEVVRPALARGLHVVSDRYAHSSIAYQGYGRGLAIGEVRMLSDWAADGLWPDLVVFLDLAADAGADLAGDQSGPEAADVVAGRPGHHPGAVLDDRFETEGGGFHDRVVAGFRELSGDDPERWVRIDASGSIDAVAAAVRVAVRDRLQLAL